MSKYICQHFKRKKNLSRFLYLCNYLLIFHSNPGNHTDLQCFIYGECNFSQGLDIFPSRDEFQCLKCCQQNASCTWFSFYPDTNLCQTFLSCGSIENTLCQNCISGQRECENPAPICFAQGNLFWILFLILHSSVTLFKPNYNNNK